MSQPWKCFCARWSKYGKARRVWIFDRGVVSEQNLATVRKHGGQYLVGTARSRLKQFEGELLKDDFEKIRPDSHYRFPGLVPAECFRSLIHLDTVLSYSLYASPNLSTISCSSRRMINANSLQTMKV